ncbi:putative enzyme related to lactoylglutathione lyase [Streptacidiphilus sp. MAP12-20]|uniref:VOC family protein n=1 Tax=Streptacidiphilus sp. MAP12-20 TaxID=3156299 RepID=UPI0035171994
MSTTSAPYAPGTPCWVDLMAKDQQAALDFYKDVFGWAGEPGPAEFGGYAVMELGGRPVCGIGPAMAMEGQPAPPHVWTTYLASDDADATAAKITAAHGTLMFPPMDVGTLGRMLVAADPTGAVFGVWGHKDFFGAVAVNEPGSLCWNECNTRDVPAAAAFYEAAMDIKAVPMEQMAGYFGLEVGGKTVGGLQDMGSNFPPEVPPHWMTWFCVDDTDSTVDAAVKRGATVVVPPMDIPPGRMAAVQDPWGAVFCMLKLAVQPE